jgi:outer membrane protein assembly factor BamB
MTRSVRLILLAMLLTGISNVGAGEIQWEAKIDGDIRFKVVHDTGILLVGTKNKLFGIDPDSGQEKWRVEKLAKDYDPDTVRPIPGSPLMVLELKEGMTKPMSLQCIDVTTGEKVWTISRNKQGQMNDVPREWAERVTGKKAKSDQDVLLIPEGWPTSVRGVFPDFERNQFVISIVKPSIYVNYKRKNFEGGAMAVDMKTGKVNWVYVLPEKAKAKYSFSSLSINGDVGVMDWAGVHAISLVDGSEKSSAIFERKGPKNGLAATLIEEGVAYVVAKEGIKAVEIASGQIKWESEKIKGLLTETQIAGDKLVARLGGNFEEKPGKMKDFGPYGVTVLDKASGKVLTDFKKLNKKVNLVTPLHIQDNTVYYGTRNSFRALDLATLDFKFTTDLGKLEKQDSPKSVVSQDDIICLTMTQSTKGFNPATGEENWSQTFEAPGHGRFAKFAMVAVSAMAAGAAQGRANSTGRRQSYSSLMPMLSQRFTAAQASGSYNYVLSKGDKKPTLVGVSLKTGEADREAVLDNKSPDYIIDELGGVLYNIKDKKTIQKFDLKK